MMSVMMTSSRLMTDENVESVLCSDAHEVDVVPVSWFVDSDLPSNLTTNHS